MVALNVASLDDNNFSDVLFGHVRGAFTGADRIRAGMIEKARGGTLFLDEIGDLSSLSQVKLLRLLQEGEYFQLGSDVVKTTNARIVCATNKNLAKQVSDGHFREDLYYRLCSHHVHVPPLRDRSEDVLLLLDHYLGEVCLSMKKKKPSIPEELPILLSTYRFPGNVRELRSMIVDAVSSHAGGKLSMKVFKQRMAGSDEINNALLRSEGIEVLWPFPEGQPLPSFAQADELLITEAMSRAKNNQGIAAGLLGVTRQALNKRLQKRRK
ncbi:MAG: sigma 54-interacting transcriptional regulator [Desulfuromonadales bacterium]|nr:sigma 54-interacting transcriptional regulator [Desulfuromonadales bacterium]